MRVCGYGCVWLDVCICVCGEWVCMYVYIYMSVYGRVYVYMDARGCVGCVHVFSVSVRLWVFSMSVCVC